MHPRPIFKVRATVVVSLSAQVESTGEAWSESYRLSSVSNLQSLPCLQAPSLISTALRIPNQH